MPRHDYQTSTVSGAAAFERGRSLDYGEFTVADFDPPEYIPEDGDTVQSFGDVIFRKARRDHKDGKIKAGQQYAEITYGGYVVGGARWLNSYKVVLEEGKDLPRWHYSAAFERGVLHDEE
jgi:hypothetical protein